MTKHVFDRVRSHDDTLRRQEFYRMEKDAGPRASTKSLQQAPHSREDGRVLKEFIRIERETDS